MPASVEPHEHRLAKRYGPSHASGYSEALLPKMLRMLPSAPARVLEVGCGRGGTARRLAALGYDVLAIDASESGIEIAQSGSKEARFRVHSALESFEDLTSPVDAVIAVEVIEHLILPGTFLRNAFRILKPGGVVVLTSPYHGYWKNLALSLAGGWDRHLQVHRDGGHIKFFSPKTLAQALNTAGFARIRFAYFGRTPLLWKTMICRAERPTGALPPNN